MNTYNWSREKSSFSLKSLVYFPNTTVIVSEMVMSHVLVAGSFAQVSEPKSLQKTFWGHHCSALGTVQMVTGRNWLDWLDPRSLVNENHRNLINLIAEGPVVTWWFPIWRCSNFKMLERCSIPCMPRFLGQSVPRHERMVSRGAWCETWTQPTAWQTNEAELLQFQALGFLNFFFANILLRFFKQRCVELSCKPSMPPEIKSDIKFPYHTFFSVKAAAVLCKRASFKSSWRFIDNGSFFGTQVTWLMSCSLPWAVPNRFPSQRFQNWFCFLNSESCF